LNLCDTAVFAKRLLLVLETDEAEKLALNFFKASMETRNISRAGALGPRSPAPLVLGGFMGNQPGAYEDAS